jgi:hypothetical protein
MPSRKVSGLAVAVLVASVTGCAGGDDRSSLVSASKCLVRTDGATTDFATPLHEAMSGGAVRVILATNEVQVGFGKDGEEAREIGDEVRAAVSGTIAARNHPPNELVTVRRNAVLAWKAPPTEQERTAVESCLE